MHLRHNGTREGSSWPSFWGSNSFRKSPWGKAFTPAHAFPAERVIQGDVVTVELSVAIGVILEATLSGVPEPLCRVGHGFLIRTCSRFRTKSVPAAAHAVGQANRAKWRVLVFSVAQAALSVPLLLAAAATPLRLLAMSVGAAVRRRRGGTAAEPVPVLFLVDGDDRGGSATAASAQAHHGYHSSILLRVLGFSPRHTEAANLPDLTPVSGNVSEILVLPTPVRDQSIPPLPQISVVHERSGPRRGAVSCLSWLNPRPCPDKCGDFLAGQFRQSAAFSSPRLAAVRAGFSH